MAKLKKVLSWTLVLALMLSLSLGGVAQAAEKGQANTYDLETVCYDWGQPVEYLYLNLSDALPSAVTANDVKEAFTVKALGITYYSYADAKSYTEDFDRVIEDAKISADRKTVTLHLKSVPFDNATSLNFTSYEIKQTKALDSLAAGSIDLKKGEVFDEKADLFARFETKDTGLKVPYRLYTPAGSGKTQKPLIVWLHGGGETGTDNNAQLTANLVTNWASKEVQDIFGGAYVMAPQSLPSAQHEPAAVMAAIQHVLGSHKDIDLSRIYIGGCSMGGLGTWDTILAYPDFFAAAFPICPAKEPTKEELKKVKDMDIWIVHAVNDSAVDLAWGVDAYNNLIEVGAKNTHMTVFDYVTFPGLVDAMKDSVGHWSWIYVHRNFPSDANEARILPNGSAATSVKGVKYESVTSENPKDLGYESFMHWIKEQQNMNFTDVEAGDWYYGDVKYVWDHRLMNGTDVQKFAPDAVMTRGMLVAVLGRADGVDVSKYTTKSFDDVAAGKYYAPYIEWAKANNIVNGVGENKFAPDRSISRAEMALILYRYAQVKKIDLLAAPGAPVPSFSDIEGNMAEKEIQALANVGVINGKTATTFDPKGTAKRSEIAAMIHRFLLVIEG